MTFSEIMTLEEILLELKGVKDLVSMLDSAAEQDVFTIGSYEAGINTIWKLLASSIDRLDALNATMTAQFKTQRQASTAITKS